MENITKLQDVISSGDNIEAFKTPEAREHFLKSIDRRTNRVILTYKELLRNMARKYKRL